ncbi:G surface protein, allelic form 168-like [Haliotis rufescens]|uniref:G surface protein, allelic form 168-like n=1 Tax=Haliotis rufescens TaxID=6454 RepID=UPI00201F3C0A|nr:G surface protein, allelic form 168-like [Haliotis rufescens]
MMSRQGVAALLLVFFPVALSKTCTVCMTEYAGDKTNAGTNNTQKCTALSTYLTCLETSAKGEAGCPLTGADAGAIETDYTGAACSETFTETCVCQKTFWGTVQADETATCTEARKYLTCLKGKTTMTCDGTSSVATLTAGVETRMKALTGCTVSPACQCQINAMKADMSTDAKKCTAYKTQYACLYGLSTGGTCDTGTTLTALKTAAAASVTGATSCTFDDTCACQRSYDAAAKDNAAAQCTAYKAELNCLGAAKTSAGCDGSTTKSAIATTAETERAKLTTASAATCPAPTSTCQCEITTAKADNSDNTKYCTVLKTMETCLSAITNTTEAGCTSTTQATLLTSTRAMYKTEKCAADHVTFVMTSLLVSLLASMFL